MFFPICRSKQDAMVRRACRLSCFPAWKREGTKTLMKLRKPITANGADRLSSHGDLISSVYHLVDCFQRAFGGRMDEEARHYHDAAQTAFSAALSAERRIAELLDRVANLEETASTDDLTQVLNRRGFRAELERALAAAGRYGIKGMLIFIDLDGFKDVNDDHGHAAGDHILRTVACILNENVRETDYVARLGGDEFAILLPTPRANRLSGARKSSIKS